MKKPKTLPFYLQNGDYLDILDSEDVIIATVNTHQNELETGEYIVESCNNYLKSLNLLNQIAQDLTDLQNNPNDLSQNSLLLFYNRMCANVTDIEEFLRSIENE